MKPILKWAGGKRKLLFKIKELIDHGELTKNRLYEPFVGGGALFMDLENPKVAINDLNKELINVYLEVRDNANSLIKELKNHKKKHSHDYYYKIRDLDRQKEYKLLSNTQKAARTIYLNRTCYNGLYRVNSSGYFNVPFGKYLNPDIVIEERIINLSDYLNKSKAMISNLDFEVAVKNAKAGDLVYFDPPYDYENYNGFTSYTFSGFTRDDLRRLKVVCDKLINKGCKVIISNNDTPFVNALFSDKHYKIDSVITRWTISRNTNSRKEIREVIIYG
jgi:DNA adenine methylase